MLACYDEVDHQLEYGSYRNKGDRVDNMILQEVIGTTGFQKLDLHNPIVRRTLVIPV